MIKQIPAIWLQVALVIIFFLILACANLGDSDAKERSESQRLDRKVKELIERVENLNDSQKLDKTRQDKLEREIKKLKSSKAASAKKVATATQPQPQQQAVVVPIGKEYIVKKIQARFGTDPRILTLVNCESSFDPQNVNPMDVDGSWDSGLFQINQCHGGTPEYWWDIDRNIQKAWELSNGGTNWDPWPTCKATAGLV